MCPCQAGLRSSERDDVFFYLLGFWGQSMIYRTMFLSLTASALVALSAVAPAQAGGGVANQPGQICGGGGHGGHPVFNIDRSVTINRAFELNRNFNYTHMKTHL